jgi:hypothetical protein
LVVTIRRAMTGVVAIAILGVHFTQTPVSSAQTTETIQTSQKAPDESDRASAAQLMKWREMLLWGVVILIVLVVGVGALVRFSRGYKTFLVRGGAKPTPSEDVWSMHRLPKDDLGDNEKK